MALILELLIASLSMAAVVLTDIALPINVRESFHFAWPMAEQVTRNGWFCREFHIVVFGYEMRWVALDNLHTNEFSRHTWRDVVGRWKEWL